MNHNCQDCNTKIPNGHAVIRSQSFQRVAYCRPCAEDRGIVVASQAVVSMAPVSMAS